jgi:trehalose 6-phosphate synthase/phosphatase
MSIKVLLCLIKFTIQQKKHSHILFFTKMPDNLQTPHVMTFDEKVKLIDAYKEAKRRLLLLDYDGTLVNYFVRPDDAVPDAELKDLLNELGKEPGNELVLISGRNAATLNHWFGNMNVELVAEHGALNKKPRRLWTGISPIQNEWENNVETIFEKYLRLYKGTFIEKKLYTFAFHYRGLSSDKAEELQLQIMYDLQEMNKEENFFIIKGNHIIEIRSKHHSKGLYTKKKISENDYDFILAIGDDVTDEDTFEELLAHSNSYTIKVGVAPTKAKCNFINAGNVISFLEQLSRYKQVSYLKAK